MPDQEPLLSAEQELKAFIERYESLIAKNSDPELRRENKKAGQCWQGVDYADCFIKEPVNWLYPDGREETWAYELMFKGPRGQRAGALLKGVDLEQASNKENYFLLEQIDLLRKLDKIFLYSLSQAIIQKLLKEDQQAIYSINLSLAILVEQSNWLSNFLGDLQVKLRAQDHLSRVIIELPEYDESMLKHLQVDQTTVLRILEFMSQSQLHYAVDDAFSKGFMHIPALRAMGSRIRWVKMDWSYMQKTIRDARTTFQAIFANELQQNMVFVVEGVENDIFKNQLAAMLREEKLERVAIQGHDVGFSKSANARAKRASNTTASAQKTIPKQKPASTISPTQADTIQPSAVSEASAIEQFTRESDKLYQKLKNKIVETIESSYNVIMFLTKQLLNDELERHPHPERHLSQLITDKLLNKDYIEVKDILKGGHEQLKRSSPDDVQKIKEIARLTLPWLYVLSGAKHLLDKGDQGILLDVLSIPAGIDSMAALIMAGIDRREVEWREKNNFPMDKNQISLHLLPEEGMNADVVDVMRKDLYIRIGIPSRIKSKDDQIKSINIQMAHDFAEQGKRYFLICDSAPTKKEELELHNARIQAICKHFPILAVVELDDNLWPRDQIRFNEISELLV
ncbi:EAL domain-containing protein [Candidatus Magnetaquicoccus inordinatus]|uniref:EAL domain-containing protein n=1 Tax=Candidatus Magnetaquicoccus inordinatus TaxID=2496818 RepID=UPI00102BE86F|nr:EAL domain-containing protein [Candidatus Magnetaquicoccus inordinatus]